MSVKPRRLLTMIRACTARVVLLLLLGAVAPSALSVLAAQEVAQGTGAAEHRPGGEVNLRLPDLNQGDFLGFTGHQILLSGLLVCVLGLLFGLWSYTRSRISRCTARCRKSPS